MEHLLNLLELVSFPHLLVNEDKIIMGNNNFLPAMLQILISVCC